MKLAVLACKAVDICVLEMYMSDMTYFSLDTTRCGNKPLKAFKQRTHEKHSYITLHTCSQQVLHFWEGLAVRVDKRE